MPVVLEANFRYHFSPAIRVSEYSFQFRLFYSRRDPLAALLQQLGDDAGPSGLVAGADSAAVIAVEVLIEEDQVLPVRILIKIVPAVNRPAAVQTLQKDACHAPRELGGDFPQCHHLAGAGRALDREFVAQVMMELLQRFDQE